MVQLVEGNVRLYGPDGKVLPQLAGTATADLYGVPVQGLTGGTPIPVVLAAPASAVYGLVPGYVLTAAANTQAVVRGTTYTEPSPPAGAQRSISSSSALDTSGGSGAQKVTIVYYTATGAGPNTDIVTLSGLTAAPTNKTDICFVESMEASAVGAGGTNAGILTLHASTLIASAAIGTIAAGDGRTFWSHHYTPLGKSTFITGLSMGNNSTASGDGGFVFIKSIPVLGTNPIELQISEKVRLFGQANSIVRPYGPPTMLVIPGFARTSLYVIPDASVSLTWQGAFEFYDQ